MKLLHIDSSALGGNSATRELTAALVARQQALDPSIDVIYRDLDATPLPHLSGAVLAGQDSAAAAQSKEVLQEFLAADVLVIGAPMYNFGIPSTLKAWIDRVTVAGTTFRYTEAGPEGLATGKTAYIAIAAGGQHAGQASDFTEPYLRQVLNFLGITDIHFVRAEGLAYGAEQRAAALAAAKSSVDGLARAA